MNRLLAFNKNPVWRFLDLWNFQIIIQMFIFLLSVLILGWLIVVSSSLYVIFFPVGLFFLYIFVKKPEIGILAIIAIIVSIIFEPALPRFIVLDRMIHFTDIILLALLLRIPFKALTDKSFRLLSTPLDIPLLLFIFAAFISAVISVFKYGLDSNLIFGTRLRIIIYYFLFFAIINLIRDRKQIRLLLGGLFAIATFVSLVMIIQAKFGQSIRLFPGRIEGVVQNSWATRLLPPGEPLIFVMFFAALCAIIILKKPFFRMIYFYLVPVFICGLLLTYNRNYWISIIFSFVIFLFLIDKKEKQRILSWIIITLVFVILVIVPITGLSRTARVYSDSIVKRFSSLIGIKDTLASGSLEWRKTENQYARQSILKHPFLGIGLNNYYRPPLSGDKIGWTGIYMHNAYFFILVDMGLLGFLPFLWFYFRFLVRGFSNWRKINDPIEKSVVIGFTLSGIAFSLVNLVSPKLMDWRGIVVIATIIGVNEAIINLNEKELQEGGR
jgi:O-antigen ligase